MDPTLLAQSLVFALDLTVTLLLWLNYRHLRLTYLALATLAGTLEIARQIVDTLIILNVDLVALWHLTSVLQFSSSLVFLGALLRVQRDARRLTWLTVPLTLMFVGIYGAQQLTGFESTTREWYVFYVPLLLTQTLIVWRGSVLGPRWPLSRVVLLVTGMALLVIRSWLPVYMHVVYDQLFYTLYYLETLICPMMLGALVLSALEHTHRRVQSLLADRIQAGTDLQFILDHSLDVIVTTDEAGTIQSWSLRGEQEFGYAHDQAVGRLTIHDLLVDHPTEGTWDVSAEFETPVRRAHGPDGLVKVRVQTVERDSRSYRIYVLQDVSAQAEIRKQRAVLDRQLQHAVKLEGLGVLAGGIAHDFNNILTSLFGNISLAKMELATHHRAWSYLTDAESSMTRATHLSGQLLTFAKGGQPVRESVHLGPLLEAMVRFDLSGSNVLPVIRAQEGLWAADVDKGQVHQVFSNLTINARQSMPDGGHLRFTLENADLQDDTVPGLAPGRYVRVVVEDEGIGIEPKHLDQIYDPFFSTKESGRGLGLATTYSIVHKHAGQIGVESAPGEGTAFTVYLPASAATPRPERGDTALSRPAGARAGRVLLMDDDDMVCKIATGMLQTIGFSVEAVSNGDQAVERYKQELETGRSFDVAILDLTIPGGKGGKEAVGDILACDPRATVIVSSGYADDPVLANHADYGFKGVVPKPYTLQQLDAAIRRVL